MSLSTNTTKSSKRPELKQPSVSVIVPIRNEEPHIESTLRQLLDQRQDGIDVEILVIDGRSTDQTREIVDRIATQHCQIRVFDNPGRLSSVARNIGIKNSAGEFLVIIDGHCEIPSRSYFVDLVDAFERTSADCLGRPQPLYVTPASALQRAIAQARSSPLGHHPDSYVYTDQETDCPALSVAVAYRRSVFEKVGYFDERFDACEDCDLNHRIDRAALRCRFVPKLAVYYQPRDSLRGLFRQQYRYGRGRVRLNRKHRDSFYIIPKLPAILLVVIVGLFACLLIPFLWTLYVAAIVGYLTMVATTAIWASIQKRDAELIIWMPVAFVTIHLGAGIGIITETLAGWAEVF